MKNLFSMLLMSSIILLSSAAFSQQATLMPLAIGDTLTGSTTVSKVIKFTAGYEGVAIQPVLTKLSGTGAGTVQIFGSLDGINYKQIGADYTITNTTTQSQVFYVTAPVPVFIKVLATGSGTESVIMRTYYVPRKHD
jgi:hypothetical protein